MARNLEARIAKLEAMIATALEPLEIIFQEYGENEAQAIRRAEGERGKRINPDRTMLVRWIRPGEAHPR